MTNSTLAGRTIPTRFVNDPNGEPFAVYGLSVSDILVLFVRRREDIENIYARLAEMPAGADQSGATYTAVAIMGNLLTSMPDMCAEAIALGTGGTSAEIVNYVLRLPIATQLEALMAIGELTFTETMPPKKVFETVISLMRQVNGPGSQSPV